MDKRTPLALLAMAIVILAGIMVLYYGDRQAAERNDGSAPINASMQGTYLNFSNGTPSKIFLVESSATFGTFTSDYRDQFEQFFGNAHGASQGDRFVNITGIIRNDYISDRDYYIALNAQVYDTKETPIGTIVRTNGRTEFLSSYMGLATNKSGYFYILLKCDRKYQLKDIKKFEITLAWEPGPTPPP